MRSRPVGLHLRIRQEVLLVIAYRSITDVRCAYRVLPRKINGLALGRSEGTRRQHAYPGRKLGPFLLTEFLQVGENVAVMGAEKFGISAPDTFQVTALSTLKTKKKKIRLDI